MGNKRTSIYEKGITLVALVVTIIVLLILAGVTINLVLGNNGVIDRAKYATNIWANTSEGEEAMMGQIENDIKAWGPEDDLFNTETIYYDINGNIIVDPDVEWLICDNPA